MRDDAEALVDRAFALSGDVEPALGRVFDADFHEGVVGIVASRLKDRFHRPTFVFAPARQARRELKGSGRSIAGFHLRDALDLVGQAPSRACCCASAATRWRPAARSRTTTSRPSSSALQRWRANGSTPRRSSARSTPTARSRAEYFDAATVRLLDGEVWGQGFAPPVFSEEVEVVSQRLVGEKHLKLAVRVGGVVRDAIWFGRVEPVGDRVRLAWRLGVDAYNGVERVQMIVVAAE